MCWTAALLTTQVKPVAPCVPGLGELSAAGLGGNPRAHPARSRLRVGAANARGIGADKDDYSLTRSGTGSKAGIGADGAIGSCCAARLDEPMRRGLAGSVKSPSSTNSRRRSTNPYQVGM